MPPTPPPPPPPPPESPPGPRQLGLHLLRVPGLCDLTICDTHSGRCDTRLLLCTPVRAGDARPVMCDRCPRVCDTHPRGCAGTRTGYAATHTPIAAHTPLLLCDGCGALVVRQTPQVAWHTRHVV